MRGPRLRNAVFVTKHVSIINSSLKAISTSLAVRFALRPCSAEFTANSRRWHIYKQNNASTLGRAVRRRGRTVTFARPNDIRFASRRSIKRYGNTQLAQLCG
ncbi:hypothetical protein EVAR_39683_1 [Eumeta japonica]|uniref:Uncharacterized protein n=1 Tax=Eumeta variegata TaxID=151549 RepID=A0A4C1Z7B7_EUMVA|nr:hypothetical protein EVAR_39683_1 [Eumeta japonica]